MFGAARLILRDSELAEDAVQDALIGAWQDLRGLRDFDRFDAWLHRLLVRACYRIAARHRRDRTLELDTDRPTGASGGGDPSATIVLRDQLERGFARLTAEQRSVIVLHHYLGLSLADAADVLGIPMGTMQSRISRATQVMRAALEADDRTPALAGEGLR